MSYFSDNQPAYRSRMIDDYIGVDFNIVARGPVIIDHDDMCEPSSQTIIVEPDRIHGAATAEDIGRIIARFFTPSPCGCEGDCCGHRHGHASYEWLTMNRVEMQVCTARNY